MPSDSECKRKFANRIGARKRLEKHLERLLTKEERTLFEKGFNMGWKYHKKEVGRFAITVMNKSQHKKQKEDSLTQLLDNK